MVFGLAGGAQVRFGVRGDLRLPSAAADATDARLPRRGFFRPDMAIVDGENSGAVRGQLNLHPHQPIIRDVHV